STFEELARANEIQRLINAAKQAVYDGICQVSKDPALDRSRQAAAAMVNWMFGSPPHPDHASILSEARDAALRLLDQDGSLRRLVVQSIRMQARVELMHAGKTSHADDEILARFGAEFPDAPDPASYRTIVLDYSHPAGKRSAAEYYQSTVMIRA